MRSLKGSTGRKPHSVLGNGLFLLAFGRRRSGLKIGDRSFAVRTASAIGKEITMKKLICAALVFVLCFMTAALAEKPSVDRAGNSISLPDTIDSIIALAPSVTQTIMDMGLGDKIVAVDSYSAKYFPELAALPQFDMMAPDCERMAMLEPDIIFVTGMSYSYDDNPFGALMTMGVSMVVVPSSESIKGIREDVIFIGDCLGVPETAAALVAGMDDTLNEVAAIAATLEEKKTVMFEIGALPYLYSFGTGTFLNEMIEIAGAENVFANQQSWISVTEESAVAANPDVILTSVDYIEDPIGEILGRTGWEGVTAVAEKAVYPIDPITSNLPNHHAVEALVEMAKAIYPDAYASLSE